MTTKELKIEDYSCVIAFKSVLRRKNYESSTSLAIEAAELFQYVIKHTIEKQKILSYDDLLEEIIKLGKSFIAIDPLQFSVGNICKRIIHFVREEIDKRTSFRDIKTEGEPNVKRMMSVTSLNRLIDYKPQSAKHETNIKGYSKVKEITHETKESLQNILTNIVELITEIETISDVIKEQAKDYINDNEIILTANHSDQLEEFFIEAAKTKKFNVIVAESAPSLNGIIQAKNLIDKSIKTTVISDSSVFAMMPKVNKVIIGTRAIMANGGLISYNGVYNVCLCAQMFNIPVIVVGGTFKLTPMYPFGHETFNEFLSPDLIYGKEVQYKGDIRNISFNLPAYDYVPPELVTIYITNNGSQNPAYIYRLFSELYSQVDYFL